MVRVERCYAPVNLPKQNRKPTNLSLLEASICTYRTKERSMTRRYTLVSFTILALALVACGGATDSDIGLASRMARSATRVVVDAVLHVDAATQEANRDEPLAEPLTLSATRPDAILEAATELAESEATVSEAVESRVGVHIVRATALPDFRKSCGETARFDTNFGTTSSDCEANVSCPLARSRSGNLTRI